NVLWPWWALFIVCWEGCESGVSFLSFEPKDLTGNTEGLSSFELDTLHDWEDKFVEKYIEVGRIISGAKVDDNINGDNADGNLKQFKEEPTALEQD
ncbi:hypothetical protein MKW92_003506, partial [Papaver armeniacum]